jgi:protein-tyrosine phosphatase
MISTNKKKFLISKRQKVCVFLKVFLREKQKKTQIKKKSRSTKKKMYDEQPLVAVRIKDGIFCGNVTAAYDEDFLVMNKVTHIVNCAGGETRDLFKGSGIQYLNFPWTQPTSATSGPNLFDASDKNIETVVRFVDETLAQGECVLIQSVHGRSRSCAVIAAYFIIKYRWTLDHALDFIAMAHEDMEIHPFFRKQLAQFYQKHEIPASNTGRALDIFHPEIDDNGFALDNEQWMLRNTYVNGLVSDAQERTDLYKVCTSRIQLAEPNPKSVAKRRRRITFCDTKQGTSVACMWTQPVIQNRNPTPVIRPPSEYSPSIVSRPGTPNNHRLEGEANAHVHTATTITAVGIPGDPHRANTIRLQLRSNIMNNLQQNQQNQQGGEKATSVTQGLNLQRDSPMIGRGPALVATQTLDENKQQNQQEPQYNQTVSRILPAQQQEQQQQQNNLDYYRNSNNNERPLAFNNNNMVNNLAAGSQPRPGQQQQQQQAPTAANIAASLGTTGQGSTITLRGGAPLSIVSAGSTTTTQQQQQQQQKPIQTTLFGSNNPEMRPIPDANSGIRPLGAAVSSSANNGNQSGILLSSSNNNNSTTPIRPGPVHAQGTRGTTGVLPGHMRNNPFTLPASGRTAHRGSPLPQQRAAGNAGPSGSRLAAAANSNNNNNTSTGFNRTNSPMRNTTTTTLSSGIGTSSTAYSPLARNNNNNALLGSPRTNSPLAQNNRGGSPIRSSVVGTGTSSGIATNLSSLSNYHQQQRQQVNNTNGSLGTSSSMTGLGGGIGSSYQQSQPQRGSSPVGNRPSSPSRPTAVSGGGSMLGGTSSSQQWSSSLLPASSNQNTTNASLLASSRNPRTGSPLVRSNSPTSMLRTGNTIPTASSNQVSLQNPPSRPASLSSLPSSHIPRQNSPLAAGRRTGSPIRNNNNTLTTSSGIGLGSSSTSFLANSSTATGNRTNSPLAMNRGNPSSSTVGGGGSLAEQFLYRSNPAPTNNNNNNNTTSSSSAGGRNSPLMRR